MHILRQGGRYLQGWEQRAWVALFAVLSIGLAALLLVGTSMLALPVALALLLAVSKIARSLKRVRKGRLGEALVTRLLSHLSDEYWLINDVSLRSTKGNIDHVLIGPCGVVAIETKRLSGRIRCEGDRWWINGIPRKSISRQATRGAQVIKDFLLEHHPAHRSGALRFVEAIVVFTDPRSALDVSGGRGTIVIRFSELSGVILELARKRHLDPTVAEKLAKTLAETGSSN